MVEGERRIGEVQMVKLQLLNDNKIVIYDNTFKVLKNNNTKFEIQAENVTIVENENYIEISIEKNINEFKHINVYEIELVNVANDRLHAIKAVKKTFNLSLADAKDLCERDPAFVYQTKNKEKSIEIWSRLKSELLHTNIKPILHEPEQ